MSRLVTVIPGPLIKYITFFPVVDAWLPSVKYYELLYMLSCHQMAKQTLISPCTDNFNWFTSQYVCSFLPAAPKAFIHSHELCLGGKLSSRSEVEDTTTGTLFKLHPFQFLPACSGAREIFLFCPEKMDLMCCGGI